MGVVHHKFGVHQTTDEVFTWRVIETEASEIVSQHKNFSRCGYEDDRYLHPCSTPATVTDIETGYAFCARHFWEVIL